MIYFTSDTHFNHVNILKYSQRPFEDVDTMNSVLVDNINEVVKTKDELYMLGDVFFFSPEAGLKILDKIKCERIYLITGNHDHDLLSNEGCCQKFSWIKQYYELNVNKQKICLFHFPMITWNKEAKGSVHLHGHCHAFLNRDKNKRFDVGVDSVNPLTNQKYFPYSLEEILEITK